MVTKREKMRNRFLESKRHIFLHQTAILRSQSGRKLNARDYQSVISAHRQSPSVYDNPEAVVRTARQAEALAAAADECEDDTADSASVNKAVDRMKRLKMVGRPRIKGQKPGLSGSSLSTGSAVQRKRLVPTENPYAKPTYRSFEWLLPSRRRSSVGADDVSAVKRKRRRKLFAVGDASAHSEVSVSVDEDRTNSSSADFSVGKLFLDVTGSDAVQNQEPISEKLPSPSLLKREDENLDDEKHGQHFAANALSHKDTVVMNGRINGNDDLGSPVGNNMHEPSSSTPLRHGPLHSLEERLTPNHTSTVSDASPHCNVSKLQARHFSDILVSRTSPSRNRTTSQNDEDAYIDVVSDTPIPPSTANPTSSGQLSIRNGFAEGLSRLSKAKAKKHLVADGLVNGLRQRTLDSFIRRIPNGNRCPNGIDVAVENVSRAETKTQDLSHSSASSSKLQQNAADQAIETKGTPSKKLPEERTSDGSDNFVDMDSIEGVWRRRTSLRSSTAFMSLLGPDLAEMT